MAAITKPITTFEKTIERAQSLLDLYKNGVDINVPDDIVRAAVVLSVAGFDRYFTSKYCDVLVPYLKDSHRISSAVLERLEKAGLNSSFALELAVSRRPYRKIRTIVQNSLSTHTTHRTDVIDELFLSMSLDRLCKNAQARAKRKNLITRLSKLVDIRNDIAHEAQNNRRGNPKSINASDIEKRISDMVIFVQQCDQIIDNKFGISEPVSA